ncbi:MAG: zinc ribbon domain-containing protein [Ruminococcus sp.]|nr:zinc ribbon domain-containing protein [Ruminococcus sp.]
MAKVKCEYCGNYILNTESTCPKCGAVNENHQRIADGTPKTITQLQVWYKTRGLPPEETTRFFIGKDVKEPRAFGIYEENGTFTVYKNKSDGSRAIRYKGTDEAYAVNELYLRLKEEILNQKSINIAKRGVGNRPGPSVYNTYSKPKRSGIFSRIFIIFMLVVVFLPTVVTSILSIVGLTTYLEREHGYYVTNTSDVYYSSAKEYDNGYEWWFYDPQDDMWELYATFDKAKHRPAALSDEENYVLYTSYLDVKEHLKLESDKFPIEDTKEYIDAGHHRNPSTSYYYYNDDLYYFIDDEHSSYGSSDNTGWYIYNKSLSDWEYYCSVDNKDALGDDLWYSDGDYWAGSAIDDIYGADEYLTNWTPSGFEDTSWYRSYESNESAYQQHLEEENNNRYDSDSDYDWDSGDSWDSGGTDWDSDW